MDDSFERRVRRTLLATLDCDAADADRPGTSVIPRERMAGTGLVLIWHVGARAFAEVDPALAGPMAHHTAAAGSDFVLTVRDLAAAVGPGRVRDADATLCFLLHPDDLIRHTPPPPLALRRLSPDDAGLVRALNDACTPEEVDAGFVAADHELAFACLDEERAVSVVSAYRRNGFMDMGSLTHPAYRGRRLAPAALAATCEATFALDLIPQYRCDVQNTASRRVAEVTGFKQYFTSEHAWVAG